MIRSFALASAMLCGGVPAWADTAAALVAQLELNAVQTQADVCRMTFTAQADEQVDALVVETVLFTTEGTVQTLTLFDFGALPSKALRVRQFDLAQTDCATIGRVLFNGINSCTGAGCGAGDLAASSRVEGIEVLK